MRRGLNAGRKLVELQTRYDFVLFVTKFDQEQKVKSHIENCSSPNKKHQPATMFLPPASDPSSQACQ